MLCQFAAFFQRSANIIIIGELGDSKKLAGVGLGNAQIENFGMCVWMGLIGGLQTQVSNSIGCKQYENCGVYR